MGLSDVRRAKAVALDIQDQARKFFEPQLIKLELSEDQIKNQNLEELEDSLARVNDAINHPNSFGILKLSVGVGSVFLSRTESNVELGILPILLDRKKLIVERIGILKGQAQIEDLKGLIKGTADLNTQTKLEERINALQSDVQKWQERAEEVGQAQIQAQLTQQVELARVEVFERRSKIWQSFLERESVATILGGMLLLLITAFLIGATIAKIQIPEILSNAFLLILGYFFGQSVSRAANRAKSNAGA